MILRDTKQILAVGLSLVLITTSSYGYRNAESVPEAPGGATDGAPMSASELDALVAPIALYPDALVAQILAAATFPDQVAIADYWLHENQALTGTSLMQAVDKQSWDSSVKALTEFPSVLDNLAKNLTWTSSLGEAYHNQPSEVMEAIQTLRAKAKAAGNLKSSSQITVVQQTPQTIVIQPANPQVVYVPEYNPAVIYGTPYVTPGYTAADVAAAGVIGFGAGIAVGALRVVVADGDGIPGTVTGMVARWFTTTTTSTEMPPGMVATTTAAITLATATTTPTTERQSITSLRAGTG